MFYKFYLHLGGLVSHVERLIARIRDYKF